MRIGIIGAGNIGGTLGKAWSDRGHEVVFGVRDPHSPKTQKALSETGGQVQAVRFEDAAAFGDVLVLAVPWAAVRETVAALGNVQGKIIIDATNRLTQTAEDAPSAAEDVQKLAVGAKVVKAFNTMGWETLANPIFNGTAASTFLCGDDATAKGTVGELAGELGLQVVDCGPLANAAAVESIARLWIYMMRNGSGRDMAFTLVRR